MMTTTTRRLLAFALLLLAGLATSCKEHGTAPGGGGGGAAGARPGGGRNRAFPVEVAPVEQRSVEYTVHAVGSVEAFEQVAVTARVAGAIEQVSFREGEIVKANQVLVTIEPRRYALAVASAAASLEKAEAAKADAEAGLARRERASTASPGLIPGEEIETWRTKVRTAVAEVAAATVGRDKAELDRHDAYVRAPIGGVIQTRTAQTGAYVQPGAVMATLERRDPLLLRFGVAERDAAVLVKGQTVHFAVDGGAAMAATITHVAAAAEDQTRMVAVIAEVAAADVAAARPGAFAEVTVPIGAARPAAVVPQIAVRPSERGFLAFVIEDGIAKERVLSLGMRTADGLVEVKQGLTVGEQLVIRGAEALRDGAAVKIAAPGGSVAPGNAASPGSAAPATTPDAAPAPAGGPR